MTDRLFSHSSSLSLSNGDPGSLDLIEISTGGQFPCDVFSCLTAEIVSSETILSGKFSPETARDGADTRKSPRRVTGPKSPMEEAQKKEKNRLAAKQCRKKKKEQEKRQKQDLCQLRNERIQLLQRVKKLSALYLNCLGHFPTRRAFEAYIRQNPHLVRDPEAQSLLRVFIANGFKSLV